MVLKRDGTFKMALARLARRVADAMASRSLYIKVHALGIIIVCGCIIQYSIKLSILSILSIDMVISDL